MNVPDTVLAAALRTVLGLADGAPIPATTLAGLQSLTINNPSDLSDPDTYISDLTGLEDATSLAYLVIWNHDIRSLEPIKNLPLTTLRLTGSDNLGDISHIQGLTTLKYLFLGNTGVSDLAPLANMTDLQHLDLKNNQIQDISALANLTKLTALTLWNRGNDRLVPPIPWGNNQIRDIGPLANMTEMEYLYLDYNQISDLTPLANMTKLVTLELEGNYVSDISPLPFGRMRALRSLNLTWNGQIRDISPLARAPQRTLETLFLGRNQISDISPLAGLTALKWLHLYENKKIRDISALTGLTALERLYLHDNEIRDISALTGLTALERLYLHSNKIRDISPLTELISAVPDRTGLKEPNKGILVLNYNPLNYASIYTHLSTLRGAIWAVLFSTDSGAPTRSLASLVSISGDEQTGMFGVPLAAPFVVETRDDEVRDDGVVGKPFAGVPLTFAITEGGGTLNPVPTETDDDGRAESTLTQVRTLGRHTVEVTVIHEGTTLRTVFTADVLPGALTAPTLGDALPTTLEVSWAEPAYPVEGYEVRYRVKDSETWTDATHEGTGTSITLTDLIPGTAYEAQIRAQTTVGPSPWSPSVSGMTAYVLLATRELAPSPVALDRLVFNELRNANDDKHDWLEVKNISGADMPLAGWEISIVASAGGAANQDVDIITFPDYTLPAGEVLLIVNTSPSETDLASGVNIATGVGKKGAKHRYLVSGKLKLPQTAYLLLLRSATDKNGTAEALEDVAGNYFRETGDFLYGAGTQVWPLQDTERPLSADAAPLTAGGAWARVSTDKRGYLAAAWSQRGYQAGLGYKRGAAAATSLGTPGYANTALTAAPSGRVSISELMFAKKAGRRTVPQWLELYNNSMTEAVKLEGWQLEVEYLSAESARRHRFDAVSLTPLTVLPNQTVLLVTWRAETSGHFPEGRLYNLYFEHPAAFSQRERRNDVLNPLGFSVRLLDAGGTLVDSVGNLDGVARTKDAPIWEVPSGTTADGARVSLIRKYEDSAPLPGTEADSWVSASAVKLAVSTYYGWETDIGTPGYRDGGPLPVALSQFQSVWTETGVVIRWTTESSLDNAGFNLLRGESRPGPFTQINRGLIAGAGTTGERQTYSFTDGAAKPRVSYYYRLEEVSFGGVRQVLATTRVRGHVTASGKLTMRWSELKSTPRE